MPIRIDEIALAEPIRQALVLLQGAIALADYIAASHLLVSPRGDMAGLVDTTLEKLNLKRRVVMSMPNFLAAALVLANTNLIATLPERIAKLCALILNLHLLVHSRCRRIL